MLKEPDIKAQGKSLMWVQRGGPPDKPMVLLNYDPSRSSAAAEKLLDGYQSALMYRQATASEARHINHKSQAKKNRPHIATQTV